MSDCRGCELQCPAVLAATTREAELHGSLTGLDARAEQREETAQRWDAALAVGDPAKLTAMRYVDDDPGDPRGEPVGTMYAARDNSELFAGLAARADGDRRDGIGGELARLAYKISARREGCGNGPLSRTLGLLGMRRFVCLSSVRNDGLPNH